MISRLASVKNDNEAVPGTLVMCLRGFHRVRLRNLSEQVAWECLTGIVGSVNMMTNAARRDDGDLTVLEAVTIFLQYREDPDHGSA